MRVALFTVLVFAMASCSSPTPDAGPDRAQGHINLDYNVAYEATEGGFRGMSMFIDPASGETWVAFRDEREGVSKEGFGDPLSPCSRGSIKCFQTTSAQPLLSALPPADFLQGAFSYSAQARQFWSMPCNEISAVSARGTTISVVCPRVGLVEFSFVVTGSESPLERYQLRSMNGLFAER